MPSKYIVRDYLPNTYYHIFNRGVEKRDIFLEENDYRIFLYYLFIYLADPDIIKLRYPKLPLHLKQRNLQKEVDLLCFCLMPNHFHLLIHQISQDGITKLMRQLSIAYTTYFNNKHDRVGSLYQGTYKAVEVKTDEQLIYLSCYIHLNPLTGKLVNSLKNYKWSSYNSYIGSNIKTFCNKKLLLSHFNSTGEYEKFVSDKIDYIKELKEMENLLID